MITYLRGQIASLTPTEMIVECGGVGYSVHISLQTYSAYTGKSEGRIFTAHLVREDAQLLYGFATEQERELFYLLTGVSGIGPNTARLVLSAYSTQELRSIIAQGLVDPLKSVKGIGLKTAQRILLEVKGKIELTEADASGLSPAVAARGGARVSPAVEEATSALKMLGYAEVAITKALKTLSANDPAASAESLIRQALKVL